MLELFKIFLILSLLTIGQNFIYLDHHVYLYNFLDNNSSEKLRYADISLYP